MQIERVLQQECALRLRNAPLDGVIVPIPNSIYYPARTDEERRIIARVIGQMKALGALLPGAADWVVLAENFSGCIEFKRPSSRTLFGPVAAGRRSAEQNAFALKVAAARVPYGIVHSWDECRETLVAWGRLPQDWGIDGTRRHRV